MDIYFHSPVALLSQAGNSFMKVLSWWTFRSLISRLWRLVVTFDQAYRELEEEFRGRVADDCRQWKSVYLPNVAPQSPVDYVLVAMEPSLKGWAKDFSDAKKKIELGFRNFCGVWQLHYPVGKYLCKDGETFYLTDLAKGAMATDSPGAANEGKYEAWYPLLERELGLVAKPDAKIISVGGRVGSFLSKKGLYGHVGTIPHYSGQAAGHWGQEIPGREEEFKRFRSEVGKIPSWTHAPYQSCDTGHKCLEVSPTKAQVKLLFDYKVRFERIRQQERTGWRQQQREWQHRFNET